MQDDIQIIRAETACDGQKPTNRALRGCAEWLQQCLRLGYDRDCLDALEALWWKYHNHRGELT